MDKLHFVSNLKIGIGKRKKGHAEKLRLGKTFTVKLNDSLVSRVLCFIREKGASSQT